MTDRKQKKKMSDKNKVITIFSVFAVIVLLYIGIDAYYDRTGSIRTEYINTVTQSSKIIANGFAVRSESDSDSGNSYVLTKDNGGIYAPVVSDGESVAKNNAVAYVFKNETQLSAYRESIQLGEQIELLTDLQDSGNISFLDVNMINSEIASTVRNYVDAADHNDFSSITSISDTINYKITSMQIATGKEFMFTSEITSLQKKKNKADKKTGTPSVVTAPTAGYFSSKVDGFENSYSFKKIATQGMQPSKLKKLLSSEKKVDENAYGKIISEHTWYFAFNMDFMASSSLKKGLNVYVDFPKAGISNLAMKITSITREDDEVCVVLKCVTMNDKLLSLRKETAEITIANYTGCKISKDAVTSVNNILGVYVLSGNCCYFKPIQILYDNDDYIIATALMINDEKNNGGAEDDLHTLKVYDKVITKGRNLYDGKVIG